MSSAIEIRTLRRGEQERLLALLDGWPFDNSARIAGRALMEGGRPYTPSSPRR